MRRIVRETPDAESKGEAEMRSAEHEGAPMPAVTDLDRLSILHVFRYSLATH